MDNNNKRFELDDDALNSVAGGADNGTPRTDGKINAGKKCKYCKVWFNFEMLDEVGYTTIVQCTHCNTSHKVTFHGDGLSFELMN